MLALSTSPTPSNTLPKDSNVPWGPIALCRKECNLSGEGSTNEKCSIF